MLAIAAAAAALVVAALATRNPATPVPAAPLTGEPGWQAALPAVAVRTVPLAIRRFRPLTFWLCLAACLVVALPESLSTPGTVAIDLIALVPAACSAAALSRHQPLAC